MSTRKQHMLSGYRVHRDGSYATQRDREHSLALVATQLYELGYRHMDAASLKPKHVEALVECWKAEDLAIGTMKNRMAELRWWAEKIGKQNVLARDNDHYGIGKRQYVTNISKARELVAAELAKVTDAYTQMSLRLQAAFGLRRAESIKICPDWADRGDRLALKGSWAKGGRAITRPAVSTERLSLTAQGNIRYRLKTPYRDGTTDVVFEPLDFMARLAALVPTPRVNLTRYHGVFAPNHRLREQVTPARGGRRKAETADEPARATCR